MPVLVPGISVTDTSEIIGLVDNTRLGDIILCCTRSVNGSAAERTLQKVSSTAELVAKIGTVPAIVIASFERMRATAPNSNIYMIAGDTGATALAKLQGAINAIPAAAISLDMAVVVCPESATLGSQADETALWTTAEAVVAAPGWDWLYFHNFRSATNTKLLADASSLLMTSPQGNSAKYWGFTKDSASRDVPLAVDAAAWLVQLSQTRDTFRSPAGMDCPVTGGTLEVAWQMSLSDANDVMDNRRGYNYPWLIRGTVYPWNAHTGAVFPAATDRLWEHINSRLASTTLQSRLSVAGLQSIFKPSNRPQGAVAETELGKIAAIYEIVSDFDGEGGFADPPKVDGVQPPRFTIKAVDVSSGKQELEIRCYFIKSTQEAKFRIVATARP
jgi:hypothetical protein